MKVILVDSQIEIRDLIEFYLSTALSLSVSSVDDVSQAIELMKSTPGQYHAVMSGVVGIEPQFELLFKWVQENESSVKIVICDNELPTNPFFKENRSKLEFVHRPNYVSEFANLFSEKSVSAEYRFVSFEFLAKTRIAPANLYVRISKDHYLMVFKKDAELESSDYEKYQRKGVPGLYLVPSDYEQWMTALMDQLTTCLAKVNPATDAQAAADLTLDLQGSIAEVARTVGVSPQLESLVKSQMGLHSAQLKSYGKLGDLLSRFLKDGAPYAYVHSAITGMIAGHIAVALEWESDLTLGKLSLAAILHDVAVARPAHAVIQVESELFTYTPPLSSEEIHAWRNHPVAAGGLVRGFEDLSKESAQIIEQHHEFPDGSGLRGLKENQIAPLAAVFIVAHDFANYFMMTSGGDVVESYREYRNRMFSKGTFKRALAALQ